DGRQMNFALLLRRQACTEFWLTPRSRTAGPFSIAGPKAGCLTGSAGRDRLACSSALQAVSASPRSLGLAQAVPTLSEYGARPAPAADRGCWRPPESIKSAECLEGRLPAPRTATPLSTTARLTSILK